jgi:hypothetical protein
MLSACRRFPETDSSESPSHRFVDSALQQVCELR